MCYAEIKERTSIALYLDTSFVKFFGSVNITFLQFCRTLFKTT